MSVSLNTLEYPISTILLFSVDDDFTFYFAVRSGSFKDNALINNPKISLSVWEYNKMLVQAHGTAMQITNPQEIDQTLDKLATSVAHLADFWPPVLRLEGGDYKAYKINLKWLRALDLSHNVIKEADMPFTEYHL